MTVLRGDRIRQRAFAVSVKPHKALRLRHQCRRRLTLKCHRSADAEDRGDRIENAPAARRFYRIHALFRHCAQNAECRRIADIKLLADCLRIGHRIAQQRRRNAPALLRGKVSAGLQKRHDAARPQMRRRIAEQQLAAPDAPVIAVAGAVIADADHALRHAVFRHARENMRIMMLHFQQRDAACFGNLLRSRHRIVQRMHIADDRLRLRFEQTAHPVNRFAQRVNRPDIRHIADIGRRIEQAALCDAERIFQFAADCENLLMRFAVQHDRQRRESAGAPDHIGLSVQQITDRIVCPQADLPVMREDQVTESADLADSALVVAADRCALCIAARHHEAVRHFDAVRIIEQEHLHGRIGQHDADREIVRCDHIAKRHIFTFFEQYDRLLPAGQQCPRRIRDHTFPLRRRQIAHHHRKGLHRAVLQLPQSRHRLRIFRIAAEMKAADALDRRDLSLRDRPPDSRDRIAAAQRCADDIDLRPAFIAADRLRIEPAVIRIVILPRAFRTHRKFTHTRPLAVIGHRIENGQPRAALRTVDERMQIAPVMRIEQLGAAMRTGRDIRRDKDIAVFLFAFDDAEIREYAGFLRGDFLGVKPKDHGAVGRTVPDLRDEGFKLLRFALRDDFHIGALICGGAAHTEARRRDSSKGPEPDPLHNSIEMNIDRLHNTSLST